MPKSKKLPALQFYPGDWRKSMDVQSLSFHDRGVWFEMLMVMHDSERRGVLVLNGRAMADESIARCIGLDNQTFNQTLSTLLTSGVAEREHETGAVMSRRMVRDEKLREIRVEAGSKGGNPALVNQNPTTGVNQNPTPSSSSSLSSSKQEPTAVASAFPPSITDAARMATGKVMNEAPLSGIKLMMAIEQTARHEITNGVEWEIVANTMLDSWREFKTAAPKLEYVWGAEKFFGEGNWKDQQAWPWKPDRKPKATKGKERTALDEIREQEAADGRS